MGDLRRALRWLGLWPQAIGHEYCPAAVAVVKAFQDAHGLSPNGIVCELTWGALGRPGEAVATRPGPAPPEGARLLLVDTNRLTLTLYVKGQPFRTWPVAIGRQGLDTPLGEWRVRSKGLDRRALRHPLDGPKRALGAPTGSMAPTLPVPSAPVLPRAASACITGRWRSFSPGSRWELRW